MMPFRRTKGITSTKHHQHELMTTWRNWLRLSTTVVSASVFGKSAMLMAQQVDYMNGQAWWGMRKKSPQKFA